MSESSCTVCGGVIVKGRCGACYRWSLRHGRPRRLVDMMGLALLDVPLPDRSWTRFALCRGYPSLIFFTTRGEKLDDARRICNACPVMAPCRMYALDHPQVSGFWGGLSDRQRRLIRKGLLVTPPNTAATRGALDKALQLVATRPGAWARVAHYGRPGTASTTASLLRTGRRPAPPGAWEFVGHRDGNGGSDLYARCL